MAATSIRRSVGLLAACQALLLCNAVTLIAVNGLVGVRLAPTPKLATLTITGYVIGTALMTIPASQFMKRFGRRSGFMFGAGLGGLACALALQLESFWPLCCGTLIAGSYNAFGLQYRFAAADMAPADLKAKAISYTLAGGMAGGFIGPALGNLTREAMAVEFMATYASLSGFALVALLISSRLRLAEPEGGGWCSARAGRP